MARLGIHTGNKREYADFFMQTPGLNKDLWSSKQRNKIETDFLVPYLILILTDYAQVCSELFN